MRLDLVQKYLDIAKAIATEAHEKQTRWNGDPYISHPERIASNFLRVNTIALTTQTLAATVAYLHDVLEDCPDKWGIRELEKRGLPKEIIWPVVLLTKLEDEPYFLYLDRLLTSKNSLAISVKILDLIDNCSGLSEYKGKRDRAEKYLLSLDNISKRVKEFGLVLIPPSESMLYNFLDDAINISSFCMK